MKSVLVTGFGPYEEELDNPSGRIAQALDGTTVGAVNFHGCVLPVSARAAPPLLHRTIESLQPDVVIVTGVTPARSKPALERVAINVADYPIPDNDGLMSIDSPLETVGPAAYFSTLPIKAILAEWTAGRIAGYVSNTAGTYLCNQIFYTAQHATAHTTCISGLIHIPVPSNHPRHGSPSPDSPPDFEVLVEAIRSAGIVAATRVGPDLVLGAGSTS